MNPAAARAWPPPRPLRPWLRERVLAGFFVALAFSISVSQLLLAGLFLLTLPWERAARAARTRGGLGRLARQVWSETAPLRRHPLTPPFLLLAALTLLSAALSGDPGWSLWTARDTLRISAFYLVLAATRDAGHARRLWLGFLVALTLMAGYGLLQAYLCGSRPGIASGPWLADLCTHPSRIRGPFSIYMTFGGVLLLGALVFAAYLANVSWRRVWWMLPAGAVTVAALALTYSRNAWLGLAAGTLGLVATARRSARVLLVILGLGLLATALSPDSVLERARSIANPQDESVRDRVAMWRAGLAMIADHPFLGVGPGQVRAWYPHYRRPEAVRPSTGHLHNSAVHLAAERGLPALAAWVWLWVAFFREGLRVLGRTGRQRGPERALVCASLGGVAGFLVAGLFEHNFGDGEVVMLVYALMALPSIIAGRPSAAPRAATVPEAPAPHPAAAGVR